MKDAKELLLDKGILLIESFDKKAQEWGYEADQGYDSRRIMRTRNAWKKAKKELESYVTYLQTRVKARDHEDETNRQAFETLKSQINRLDDTVTSLAAKNRRLIEDLAVRDRQVAELTEKLRLTHDQPFATTPPQRAVSNSRDEGGMLEQP